MSRRPRAERTPRLTHAGETYLAARDVAITMVRAGSPISEAWIAGFCDGVETERQAIHGERQDAERLAGVARNERCLRRERARIAEEIAVTAAREIGGDGEADE
jgi:hypothetical protein